MSAKEKDGLMADMAKALELSKKALKPLVDTVYNDNGDMTVSVASIATAASIAAYFADKNIDAVLERFNAAKKGQAT